MGHLKEAAEYGAYAVASCGVFNQTELTRVERCAQVGTGIDVWLTNKMDDPAIFQHIAWLEVSGILAGGESRIAARLKEKLGQTRASDDKRLPRMWPLWNLVPLKCE